MSKSEYGYLKNVYWLYDWCRRIYAELDETVSYEYTDDTLSHCYHQGRHLLRILLRYQSYGQPQAGSATAGDEVMPSRPNGRFATVEKCSLCDYAAYDYTAAKAVIADYYGVVDGKPHTITVSDLSEAGVRTSYPLRQQCG